MIALASLLALLAASLLIAGPARMPDPPRSHEPLLSARVRRFATSVAAGGGAWFVVGGAVGFVAGVGTAVGAWVVLTRSEPASVRREREAAARELPHLVDLLAATLRAGADPMAGLRRVCLAMPGAAARRLEPVLSHASLGGSDAWSMVAADEVLAPLGRALARSQRTGAPVVDMVERLADELEREVAASIEDRARRVGVVAALPLGVCFLPAFMLLGIVPTVAALLASITA